MKCTALVFPALAVSLLALVCIVQLSGCGSSVAQQPDASPETDGPRENEGSAVTKNTDVPLVIFDELINQLQRGDDITIEDRNGNPPRWLLDAVWEINTSRIEPQFKSPIEQEVNLDTVRTKLKEFATDIARDLTIWDRLMTALDQPAREAKRYTDENSPARDSTKHLRTRLEEMRKGLEQPPKFESDRSDVQKYLRQGEPITNEFPLVDQYVSQTDGTPAQSVDNSIKLQTLHLRLALLMKIRGVRAAPAGEAGAGSTKLGELRRQLEGAPDDNPRKKSFGDFDVLWRDLN